MRVVAVILAGVCLAIVLAGVQDLAARHAPAWVVSLVEIVVLLIGIILLTDEFGSLSVLSLVGIVPVTLLWWSRFNAGDDGVDGRR